MPFSTCKNLLIVRLSAIGDVALSSALLPGLRKVLPPDAHIHWMTEGMGAEVLAGNKDVDSVILWPRKRWVKQLKKGHIISTLREVMAFRRHLRELNIDMAIDAQGLLKSGIWAWASGAKQRIGLRSREGAQYLMSRVVPCEENPTGRMCNEYRKLLEEIGCPAEPFSMSLCPTEVSREEAAREIPDDDALRPIMLYPFTTRPQKHWFPERWAELIRGIVTETGHPVWILGGPSNEADAKAMAEASQVKEQVRVIAGTSSNIIQKMGLIERAAAAVGVDTGLSHISLGLNTPTVVLFGSTCGYTETSPLPGIILYEQMPCSPCRRHPTCGTDFTCMKRITVDAVLEAIKQLLKERR